MFKRLTLTFAVIGTIAAVSAQAGGGGFDFDERPQGGFGGGQGGGLQGGGGGFQGGQGGDFESDMEEFSKQLFLSPGDRTEWEFDAKENDSVLVKITSDVFDPAVAVHDDKGKKLIENDDLEPGNQMAQLVFTVPAAGKYKVVVTNYKGTAGGPFMFSVRRFLSVPLKMGESRKAVVGEKPAWGRINLEKTGDYVVTTRGAGPLRSLNVMKPTGDRMGNQSIDSSYDLQRYRLEVTQPGIYYLATPGATNPDIKIAPVAVKQAAIESSEKSALEADEVHDWTIKGKKGDLFQVTFNSGSAGLRVGPPTGKADAENATSPVVINSNYMTSEYALAMISDGEVRFSASQPRGIATTYSVNVVRVGKPWPGGDSFRSSLKWQETQYWTFEAKPGDVFKLTSTPSTYRLGLVVMSPSGALHNAVNVGREGKTGITLDIREGGRYVVVADGSGTGDYTLAREVVEPKRIAPGETAGDLRPGTPDVWRFAGKEGQDVAFRIASKDMHWRVQVLAPDGKKIAGLERTASPDDDFLRLKLPATGDYSIVVTSSDGTSGAYVMKWVDLDK